MAARKTAAHVAAGGAGGLIAAVADSFSADNHFRHVLIVASPAISLVVSELFRRGWEGFDAWLKSRSLRLAAEAAREAVRRQLENPHLTVAERAEAVASLARIDKTLVQEKLAALNRLSGPAPRRKPPIGPTAEAPPEEEG